MGFGKKEYHWVVVLSLLAMVLSSAAPVHAQTIGDNLLVNGDFEDGDLLSGWPFQDNIPEVQVAPGWRAFYLDTPPSYVQMPVACEDKDVGCFWARPEFRDNKDIEFAYRVQSGHKSQKYFTFGRQHEAGLMQRVSGITPGVTLHFQAFVQLWSCMASADSWSTCPTAPYSNSPALMHARVGIDPTGGTNPWAATVIWAGENNQVDQWLQLQVEAVAQADAVTVFVYTRADWTDRIPRIHNDVYIDNASLVIVDPDASTATPPVETVVDQPVATPEQSATSEPTPVASQPTAGTSTVSSAHNTFKPAPIPEGATVYTAQPGDSISLIAWNHDLSLAEFRAMNEGRIHPNDLVWPGDEFVVKLASSTVVAPRQRRVYVHVGPR